jgi:hypothetical protein
MMPAHPNVTADESRQIASYIISLAGGGRRSKPSLLPKGAVKAEATSTGNLMVLTASYTDGGAEGAIPLTGSNSVALQSNTVSFSDKTVTQDIMAVTFGGQDLLVLNGRKGWFKLDDIDLTGVNAVVLGAGWQEAPKVGYNFDVRIDAPDGKVIGKGTMAPPPAGTPGTAIVIPFNTKPEGKQTLYITGAVEEGEEPSMVALMNATFN